jgi:hypothetical protein
MLSHHLATCDFRVAVELAARQSSMFALAAWVNEKDCRRSPITVQDGKDEIAVVPDGIFTLGMAGQRVEQTFRVEIDRATNASPTRMRLRIRTYLRNANRRDGPVAPVLFVVPSRDREATLARWIVDEAEATAGDATLFWITIGALVSEKTVLDAPIWRIAGVAHLVSVRGLAVHGRAEPRRGTILQQDVIVG